MKENKLKSGSQSQADELEQRLIDFAVRIVKLSASLPRTPAGKHVAGQILRSGTSPAHLIMVKHALQRAEPTLFTR
jgi:hypothetical protein